jgi:uncharacterized membrane protein YqjE
VVLEGDDLSERSVGELLQRASQQTAELVRQEIRLAQVELQEKGQRVVIGAGLLGGAALVALYGLGALVAAVIMLIGTELEPWLAALIVALVFLATAAILALVGKKRAQRTVPPIPEQAVESVREDVQHIKERMGR